MRTVRPQNTVEVQAALRRAHANRVSVSIRGGGSRGRPHLDVRGGLVLSTTAMRAIRIDADGAQVTAGAGAKLDAVEQAAIDHGLSLPLGSPSAASTVGGAVATAAEAASSATCATVAEFVVGMRVVLADGTAMRISGPAAEGDMSLCRLFTGSDGMLGVITEVTLRLIRRPEAGQGFRASFSTSAAAASAGFHGVATLPIRRLQLLNNAALEVGESGRRLSGPAGSWHLLGHLDEVEPAGSSFSDLCTAYGAGSVAPYTPDRRSRALSGSRGGGTGTVTTAVPVSRLAELLAGIERIERRELIRLAVVACVSHGRVHVTPLGKFGEPTESRGGGPSGTASATRLGAEIVDLGATLTSEVTGIPPAAELRRPWSSVAIGRAGADTDRGMKRALDPLGILNPGLLY
ncbi:MAG: glycolate oxidase [Pseudonocardiales bacterium]|nr:glycolate oxidase [Pseudonocardiales bacterium]